MADEVRRRAPQSTWEEQLDLSRRSQTSGNMDGTILCFYGPPATTKTSRVFGYAESVHHWCHPMILGSIPSIDIGGMFVPDKDKGTLEHYITPILMGDIPGSKGSEGKCIFFDEIGNSMNDQQTVILQIINERRLAGNKIPDDVWFACATNRPEDKTGTNQLVKSLESRLTSVEVTDDYIKTNLFQNWMKWATGPGNIDPTITSFFEWSKGGDDGKAFYDFDPDSDERGWPNPRSWTKHSRWLDLLPSQNAAYDHGVSMLGEGAYGQYAAFVSIATTLPTPEEVLADPGSVDVPTEVNASYAVISNLASHIRGIGELCGEDVDSAITYLRRFPESLALFGFRVMTNANQNFSTVSSTWGEFLNDHKHLSI